VKTARNSLFLAAMVLTLVACQSTQKSESAKQAEAAEAQAKDGLNWTSRAYPTGVRETSALLVERGMPSEVQAGQRYEYEIRVTNLTGMVLVNVVVSDTAPTGFEVPEGAIAPQVGGNVATWRLAELEAGATTTLRASAMAATAGKFRHIANVTYEAPLAGTTTIVQPKLELERQVPELVILVDGVTVSYVVRNSGTGVARDVVIEETLPDGYTLEDGTNAIRIEVGALGAGESKTIARKIKVTTPGSFEGSAKASGFGGLGAATGKQTVKITMPKLRAKVDSPARAAIGQTYTVTITIGNDGDGPAARTIAELKLPAGATYIDSTVKDTTLAVSDGVLVWNAGSVEPGQEATLAIRLRAELAAPVSYTGSVNAHGAEKLILAGDVEQYGIATVDIDVRDEVDPLEVGTNAVYLVSVRNQGTAAATNIRVVCKLEEGMLFVESTGASEGKAEADGIVFATVEELAAKATLSWRIVVEGQKEGDRRFHVEVSADQLDRPVDASESTRFFK